MKNYSDQEILNVLGKIVDGDGDDEQLGEWITHELSSFMPGISDIIFYSKEKLTPEEILKRARELSKPICL